MDNSGVLDTLVGCRVRKTEAVALENIVGKGNVSKVLRSFIYRTIKAGRPDAAQNGPAFKQKKVRVPQAP